MTCRWVWSDAQGAWVGPDQNTCGPGEICDPVPPPSFPVPADGTEFFKACIPDTGPPPNQIPPTSVGIRGTSVLQTYDPSAGNGVIIAPDLTQFTAEQRQKGLTFAIKNTTTSSERLTLQSADGITLIEHPDAFTDPAISQFVQGAHRATVYEYDNANDTWLCRPDFNPSPSLTSIFEERDASTSINSVTPANVPIIFRALDARVWTVTAGGLIQANVNLRVVRLDAKLRVECTTSGNNQQVQIICNLVQTVGAASNFFEVPGTDFVQTSRALTAPAIFTPTTSAVVGGITAGDTFALQGNVDAASNFDTVNVTGVLCSAEAIL